MPLHSSSVEEDLSDEEEEEEEDNSTAVVITMQRSCSSSSPSSPSSSPCLGGKKCCRCKCCPCSKLTLVNERVFMVPPLVTFGSSLAEFVVVFGITGFMALDLVSVSALIISLLLALTTLLYVRFDRLAILAFLMLSVSLLSSSTFLVIGIQRGAHVHVQNHGPPESLQQQEIPFDHHNGGAKAKMISSSRHGSKLLELLKSGTELRWIHALQAQERCCGYQNFTDWIEDAALVLEVNRTYKYHPEPIHPHTYWMVSCCDRNLTQDHSNCKAETIYDDWHDIVQYLFQQGCGSKLDDKYDDVNYQLLKTAVGLSTWNALIVIDIIIYTAWKKLRSKPNTNGCNGSTGAAGGALSDPGGNNDDDVFT